MSAAEPVTVHILDREYLIACTPDERDGLLAAASYLDGKMREVRAAARAPGSERIAVLAALNIAHELVTLKHHNQGEASMISQHMQALKIKLDSALAGSIK